MKAVEEWRQLLRARLRLALGAQDRLAMAVLRETLTAIESAAAPPLCIVSTESGPFAGSVGGLGAGEVARLPLTPAAVLEVMEREIGERRRAGAEYVKLGRHDEAAALEVQANLLASIVAEGD